MAKLTILRHTILAVLRYAVTRTRLWRGRRLMPVARHAVREFRAEIFSVVIVDREAFHRLVGTSAGMRSRTRHVAGAEVCSVDRKLGRRRETLLAKAAVVGLIGEIGWRMRREVGTRDLGICPILRVGRCWAVGGDGGCGRGTLVAPPSSSECLEVVCGRTVHARLGHPPGVRRSGVTAGGGETLLLVRVGWQRRVGGGGVGENSGGVGRGRWQLFDTSVEIRRLELV